MNETTLMHRIMLALTNAGARVFRNNVGTGWAGSAHVCRGRPETVTLNPGDVLVRKARPLRAGLCVGSSDIIGWRAVVVTPDMVGRSVAIFTAVEVKSQSGALTTEQQRFLGAVEQAGGIAIEARDADQALAHLKRK